MRGIKICLIVWALSTGQFCFSQSFFDKAPIANIIKVDSSDVRFLLSFYADVLDSLQSECANKVCLAEVGKGRSTRRWLKLIVIGEDFKRVNITWYDDRVLAKNIEYQLHPLNAINVKNQWNLLEPGLYETFPTNPKWPTQYKVYLSVLPNNQVLQLYTGSVNLNDIPMVAAMDMSSGLALFKFLFADFPPAQ